jgi:hypothetical protein
MTEEFVPSKALLLSEIEPAWNNLNACLDRLSVAQMTTRHDDHGWTIKDHIIHMAAWERSVVFLLQGQPRHAGLGVDEALYLNGDEDAINAVIQQQHRDLPLDQARAELRGVHQQLMDLLAPMSDEQLLKPYNAYLPDEPGEGDGGPVIFKIYGNTADHFRQHQVWIEALAERSA